MVLGTNAEDRLLAGMSNLETRLKRLEQQGGASEVILLKLDHLAEEIADVKRGVDKINSRVGKAEGSLTQHETRVTVLETFCQEQVKPALSVITDNRIQIAGIIAKYGAGGLGIGGGIVGAVFMLGKGVGWW